MRNLKIVSSFVPMICGSWLLAACNPVTTGMGNSLEPADLGICTQPAFPTQVHVKCSAIDPSADLQQLEGTLNTQNTVLGETNYLSEEPKTSASVAGDVALQTLADGTQTQGFTGQLAQAAYTSNGASLDLTLATASGDALGIKIELYYPQPAVVTWKGTQYAMSCQSNYIYPAATAATAIPCQVTIPGHAKMTCTNPGSTLAATDVMTIESDVQLRQDAVNFYAQGATQWDFNGLTFGTMTATQVNGTQAQYTVGGGTLTSALASDGTATFSWDGGLGGTDRIVISGADASGSLATQVQLKGQAINMGCVLSFE